MRSWAMGQPPARCSFTVRENGCGVEILPCWPQCAEGHELAHKLAQNKRRTGAETGARVAEIPTQFCIVAGRSGGAARGATKATERTERTECTEVWWCRWLQAPRTRRNRRDTDD